MAWEAGATYAILGVDLSKLTEGFAKGERASVRFAEGIEERVEKTERAFREVGATSSKALGLESAAADKAAHSTGFLAEVATGAARKVGDLLVTGTMRGVEALFGLGKAGFAAAGDLEQSVANISTIKPEIDTSAVYDELNELQTEVPQIADQLGDSLYNIFSSVDVTQAEALRLTEEFARSAVGAQTSAETFGTAALGVMNAYGLAVSDAAHISDVFFNTINLGVVSGEELASSLGPVTQSAKAAGVELDLLGALIAGVTKEGGPAAQNINNLNNFLQKFTTKDAQASLQALGVVTVDATGKFLPTLDVLRDLKERLSGMTEAARTNALQAIFPDAQARIGAQTLLSQLDFVAEALETNRTASGSATAAYEKMSATFNSQMALAKNGLMALATTLAGGATPAVTEFLSRVLVPGIRTVNDFAREVLGADDRLDALIGRVDDGLPGFRATVKVVGSLADVINDNLIPGLTTAGVMMLAMNFPLLAGQVALLTTRVIAGATAWTGYGLAMGILTTGPFIVAAAGIFGIAKAVQHLQETYANATTDLLESRDWWSDSTAALDRYAESAASSSAAVQPLAAALEELRATQEAELLSLGKRMAAGNVSQDEYRAEMKVINARAEAIQNATADLNLAIEATEAATYAQEHGSVPEYISYLGQTLPAAAGEASAAITQLSDEDLDKLTKKLESAAQEGTQALQSWINTTQSFTEDFAAAATEHWAKIADIDQELAGQITADRRAELETQRADLMASYQQQQTDRAAAYATEAAAHRAHLGEMLIETVNSWVLMNKVPVERAQEMNAALATEYGISASNSQVMFGQMIGHLMNWSENTSIATGDVIGDMRETGETALETEQQMQNLSGEYVATLIQNFLEGKLDADELRKALERVPPETRAMIITNAQAVAAAVDAASSALDRLKARDNQTVRIHAEIDGPIEAHSPSPMETSLRNISEIIRTMPVLRLNAVGNVRDLLAGTFVGKGTAPLGNELHGGFYDAGKLAAESFYGGFVTRIPMLQDDLVDTSKLTLENLLRSITPIASDAGEQVADAFVGGFVDKQPLVEEIAVDTSKLTLENLLNAISPVAFGAGTNIMDHISAGIFGGRTSLDDALTRTAQFTLDGLQSAIRPAAFGAGSDIMQHIGGGAFGGTKSLDNAPIAQTSGATGFAAGQSLIESLRSGWEEGQPAFGDAFQDSLLRLRHERLDPWLDGTERKFLLSGGWMAGNLSDGLLGNRAPLDAAAGLGRGMAAALMQAWGPPVLPPPSISGSPVPDSVAGGDQSGSSHGSRTPIIIQQNFGPGTPQEARQQARQGAQEGINAHMRQLGERL